MRFFLSDEGSERTLIDLYGEKPALTVDFSRPALAARRRKVSMRAELLIKAINRGPGASVLDMTAGLGTDAFILAAYGHQVTMLERSKTVYLLTQDGLDRAKANPVLKPIVDRMELYHWDSTIPFASARGFDAAIVDPMFEAKKKNALSKGEMQMLQSFIGKGAELTPFLRAASRLGIKRSIVKRPRSDRLRHRDPVPVYQLEGRRSRLDVFLNSA
ncbi:MAG: class I SAM-dependent methyltransferase [Pseudomonadales bacterium]